MITETIKAILDDKFHELLFIGEAPTDNDVCIAITEHGGPHGTYFSGGRLNIPYVRVFVRDPEFLRGYDNVKTCKEILAGYADERVSIVLKNDIVYLGRDIKRRNEWQLLFKVFYT